jgi:alkylation response protein AidB-like acyl-CoA dehydrogenase
MGPRAPRRQRHRRRLQRRALFADAEALYSYEGTYQMQNLIVGKAITGLGAFV